MLKLLERMPELKMRVDPSKGDRRARIRAAAYAILTVTAAFALLQVCHLFGLLALVQLPASAPSGHAPSGHASARLPARVGTLSDGQVLRPGPRVRTLRDVREQVRACGGGGQARLHLFGGRERNHRLGAASHAQRSASVMLRLRGPKLLSDLWPAPMAHQ